MAASFFHIDRDGSLSAMRETGFESEDQIRQLLANHPEVLARDATAGETPRRWFAMARQDPPPVAPSERNGEASGGNSPISHLYVDQDGAPALVEVKLRADPREARDVVGRIIEHAANAKTLWPIDQLRAAFVSRHARSGADADQALRDLIGEIIDPAAFWTSVEENLENGRIRMVFVVDEMPQDLASMAQFLNVQLTPAAVYAIEVRQHLSASGQILRTSVVGQDDAAVSPATTSGQSVRGAEAAPSLPSDSKEAWVGAVRAKCDPEEARVLDDLARWMREQYGATSISGSQNPSLGLAVKEAGKDRSVFGITANKKAVIYLGALAASPTYESEESRQAIVNGVTAAGVVLTGANVKGEIRMALKDLAEPEVRERMLTVLDDVIETLRLKESRGAFGV